jgi:ABC-2 type transport system permease protein
MRRRLLGIVRKEVIHILRDWRTLLILLLMPILMIVLYGYAITMDMRDIRFAVIDEARTPESRDIVAAFSENGFFVRVADTVTRASVEGVFHRRVAQLVVVIPSDLSERLRRDGAAQVQLLVDASDSNVGTFIASYSGQVLRIAAARWNRALPQLLRLEPRILYNPEMKSSNFFVPGLVALILILINALLTSIAITREKETGTLEQILVSPVRPVEIVAGKVLPYIGIGFFNGAMILLFARVLFGVPVHGSLLLLSAMSLVYIFVALAFGLLVSTVARSQQLAMLITLMATILPTIMLSGFIFPVASMPEALRLLSYVVPASYYLVIIRSILLKGAGLDVLWPQAVVLTAFGAGLLAVAVKRFKTTLE